MILEYCGKKKQKDDHTYKTGIWTPGMVRAVDDTTGLKMLQHPDCWKRASDKKLKEASLANAGKKEKGQKAAGEGSGEGTGTGEGEGAGTGNEGSGTVETDTGNQPPLVNLDTMDAVALVAYAHREFGVELDPKTDPKELIATIRSRMNGGKGE